MKSLLLPLALLASCAARGDDRPAPANGPQALAQPPDPALPETLERTMPLPSPAPLHPFLERFLGTWDVQSQVPGGPGEPPMVMRGVETVEAVGPWIQSSLVAGADGSYRARLALTHDPAAGAFIGTWIDSSRPTLWLYRCWVAEDGRTFTAESEGPSFTDPDRTALYRDITEFIGDGRRLQRSLVQGEDGRWTEFSSGVAVRR